MITISIFSVNPAHAKGVFVAILAEADQSTIEGDEISSIRLKDKIFKTTCTYEAGIEYLKKTALEQGTNLVKITGHKKPDAFNSCHRFDATFYKVNHPRAYEKKILWSEKRMLEWEDFRADKQPHAYNAIALTYCGIEYSVRALTSLYGNNTNYVVKCIFYPEKSWAATDSVQRTDEVLIHEQKHFDLCEVYARRLYKELTNTKINAFNLDDANTVYQRIMNEYEERQYLYDEETHKSTNKDVQEKWNEDIARELEELKEYADRN